MVKKISALVLAGMLALPAMATAGSADMQAQIDALTRQLEALKAQMEDQEETFEEFGEKAEAWDLASRIQLSGDFRARADYVTADTPSHFTALSIGQGVADFWTAGNVMERYDAQNAGATVGSFGAAFAGPAFGGGPGSGYNVATGQITTTADTPIILTAAEGAAIGRVFQSATVQGILTALAGNDLTTSFGLFQGTSNLVAFMKNSALGMSPTTRTAIFNEMGYGAASAARYDNDTMFTNRFRMNMRVKALENVEFKGRVAMYKAWGMQNNPVDYTFNGGMGGGPFMLNSLTFDGSATRQPSDSVIRMDRAFVNWNNIADMPIWFSVGRRPTTDGPPAHLRMGADKRMATPVAYMDYPFDGISLGYAYNNLFGMEDAPGRIRFCYGRGFENGPTESGNGQYGKDTDFAGLSWDVYKKGNRFANIQSFAAFDIMNVPDNVNFPNPIEYYLYQAGQITYDPTVRSQNLLLDRENMGNIYHTSAVYMDKYQDLHYFVVGGWSRTKAEGLDELGTSLLGSFYEDPTDKDGYSFYAGVRYDGLAEDYGLKLGLEYNYGTKNWIGFTPGNDDLYASKLATRGSVVEVYGIYDIPGGEAISKYGKAFMRIGYQHYDYEYTGSGFWLGAPVDIDELANDPLNAQFYTPVDEMDQVYVTFEAYF